MISFQNVHQFINYLQESINGKQKNSLISEMTSSLDMVKLQLFENDMWFGRCLNMLGFLTPTFVYLANKKQIRPSKKEFSKFFNIGTIVELSKNQHLPKDAHDDIINYLNAIPSFDSNKSVKDQEQNVLDLHGFNQMNLASLFRFN